jgi:uncharacterized protein YegL
MVMGSLQREEGNVSSGRMLVYVVIDVSSSMQGPPLQAVNEGIELLDKSLRRVPEAIEMVHICIITFDDLARVVVPTTPLNHFHPPRLQAGGSTNMAAALELLNSTIDQDFKPTIVGQVKGDLKPMIFLLTDGEPNDIHAAEAAANVIKNRPSGKTVGTFLALGCGPKVNVNNLRRVARTVALMQDMSRENLIKFFEWVSASVAVASRRASQMALNSAGEMQPVNAPEIPKNNQGQQVFQIEF